MNMGLHLRRAAVWFRDRIAVVYEGNRFTYRELNQRVNSLANSLISQGVKKGDRVAYLSANRHQVIEAAYASYKAGLVEVPLNFRLSMGELVHMLNNSESNVLILGEEFIEAVEAARPQIQTVKHYISMTKTPPSMHDYESLVSEGSPSEPDVEVTADDIASLNYTSGTSGTLKAAMLSHRNRICHAKKQLLMPGIDIDKNSIMCHIGPLGHASAAMILPTIWRGGCNLILGGFDVEVLLETIEKERVTHLMLVPTMINFMLAHPSLKKYDLSSIRTIAYGASPMAVERIKEAIDIFGPVLTQLYGLTETSAQVTFLSKEDHLLEGDPKKLKRLASAGIPSIECEVRVVNEKGQDVGPGEVGEIIDAVMTRWSGTGKTLS
jgi:acyl-CoA synthetase (AMP-forming)/AMP-acid ligase II